MSKQKQMDHLEFDTKRALELGYGCQYGRYKADHPETLAEFEAQTPARKRRPKAATDKKELTCQQCGTVFYVGVGNQCKKYCCDECRQQANYERSKGGTNNGST